MSPRARLDQMSLLESFLAWTDSWSVVPLSVARAIQEKCGAGVCPLEQGPPDRSIYYLPSRRRNQALTGAFLACMDRELEQYPEIESFLSEKPLPG